ncbi:MAG TPA: 50S ribosomal protein L21 [Mycobacteriales bacterium]|nr:50S ribosomal protein L21 [Mycobacteriales bacterium]
MYAIVRSGGKQHKVAVGDVLTVEKLAGEAGASVSLPVVLLVDGDAVTTEAAALAQASVTAEVVGPAKGPKIRMIHYKNKSGYKRRQGHRQHLTTLRITGISASPNTSGA